MSGERRQALGVSCGPPRPGARSCRGVRALRKVVLETWWEVAPPDGMTGDAFLERLEDACAERVTATSGVEVARQYSSVLTEEIESIFAQA